MTGYLDKQVFDNSNQQIIILYKSMMNEKNIPVLVFFHSKHDIELFFSILIILFKEKQQYLSEAVSFSPLPDYWQFL